MEKEDFMFRYQRLNDLFYYIYQNQIVLPNKLSKHLNVSVRTIRSDVNAANQTLEKHGAKIILKRNRGYFIQIKDPILFKHFIEKVNTNFEAINLETPKSRINYIIHLLLLNNQYISVEQIINSVYVSYNTLQNYLRSIGTQLEKYNLELINRTERGIKIIGDEAEKRKCFIDSLQDSHSEGAISSFSNEEYYFFHDYDLDELRSLISDILLKYHISINDINLKNLILHIALMILRIDHENYIHYINPKEIHQEFQPLLNDILDLLRQHYNIYLTEGERQYLYIHIISNTDADILGITNDKVYQMTEQLLACIYQDYTFDLRDDVTLVEDLMKHFKSILSTKILDPEKRNPLLHTIKTNFPLPFEITLTSVRKSLPKYDFNEDDIGYISLHIGAAIERCFHSHFQAKNIILVCDGSYSIARILEAKLKNYFSNKINIIEIMSCSQIESKDQFFFDSIDFIISTANLSISSCPTVTVNFTLKKEDIESISRMINIIKKQDAKRGCQFFDESLFLRDKIYQNKIDLLSDLTNMLKEHDFIQKDFLDSVLEREQISGTNMNNIFAFPHPLKAYANQTKVAVALLKEPLIWHKNETVQIVFLLSTKTNEQKNLEELYNIIIEIINDPLLQKRILKSKNFQEFIHNLPKV